MLHTAALPFVLRREHGVVSGREVTSTRDHLHGLLHLDGEQLVIQWRTAREISRVGREIRTDHELAPIREVAVPLDGLAGARVRRAWRRWWFGDVLVLTAADLRVFAALTGETDAPGLVLEHPAEIVLDVRRMDRQQAHEFVSELRLAISERRLAVSEAAFEREAEADRRLEQPRLSLDEGSEPERDGPSLHALRQRA